ncbi:hypothetical protein AAHA92_10890 [Salvia divinorum]|uniref:Nucleotide-diphospho-sugar transferase domain-containing protein n=1 Tax=Salvia divinorum TaxID=28513 RepID=A0ABD1HW86_SALDI
MGIGGIGGGSTKRRVEIPSYRIQSPPLLQLPPLPPPQFSITVYRAVVLAASIGLMYIVLGQSQYSPLQSPISTETPGSESESSLFHILKSEDKEEKELDLILKKASMKDRKTVIITTVNAAWMEPSSIFDLFLESLKIGNETQKYLENLVVVALDPEAYRRCVSLHPYCYSLTTEGVDFSGETKFMSGDYLKMMWRRIDFLRSILEMGYSFIFSDADVAWMRDPFSRLYGGGDIQFSTDLYLFNSSRSRHNLPNAGFFYVKSNPRTVQFYKRWYSKRLDSPGVNEQDVLRKMMFDSFVNETGVDIRFLDTAYFGGWCEADQDLDVVVTMHVNCCSKLKSKIHDMQMFMEDWKNYKKGGGETDNKWTLPRKCVLNKAKLERIKALVRRAHSIPFNHH